MIKSYFHFQYLRIKRGKSGNVSDYVNVGFKMKEKFDYIETALPIPLTNKEESKRLENLRKKVNSSLLVILISFLILITSVIILAV